LRDGCDEVKVAAIILAAGASRRLGEPKQLIRLNGETLLERTARVCCEAGCMPVIVVLGASAEQVLRQSSLGSAVVVRNDGWAQGIASSVRAGIQELPGEIDGCVIATCDQPAVTAEHLRALMTSGEVTASAYAGRNGVPAYFPREVFERLMQLQGDAGARELLKDARALNFAGGELDVDTPHDLERARELFVRRLP
jgi:CTP:molybdopterin cytidylyltransferase MocA